MPSARKKCICQLCTCGRHMCPHRKKDQVVLGSDEHSGKAHGLKGRENRTRHRKQWNVKDEEQSISQTTDQLNATYILSDSKHAAAAASVANTGNRNGGKVRSEMESWSAKQVPKTMPIKRPDNLKSEGASDFTTTHQHDYKAKRTSSLAAGSVSGYSETTKTQHETWSNKQMSKTQKIKKADTLMLSGPLQMETTHQAEYNESALRSTQGESNQAYQRPRTSLKLSGEFQTDSSYQRAFTVKQPEDAIKIKKGTSKSNLKPEGEMTFNTTSLDYNVVSEHVSRASEGEQVVSLKPKRARPDSEIKIPSVPLADETTLVSDYKRWSTEMPSRPRPSDTLKLGGAEDIDGKSSFRSEEYGMETSMSDYKKWEVKRPVVHKPQNNLKPEGDIQFSTTHDDYSTRQGTIDRSFLEPVTERTETESIVQTSRDAHAVDVHASELAIASSGLDISVDSEKAVQAQINAGHSLADSEHDGHATVDGGHGVHVTADGGHGVYAAGDGGHDVFATADGGQAVAVSVVDATVSEVSQRGHTDDANFSVNAAAIDHGAGSEMKREDHGGYVDSEMVSQSGEVGHYVTWDEIRPKPIRPVSNLRQEGGMEFDTTNRREFVSRSLERVKGFRPKTSTKLFEGEFDATTMNQVMFTTDQGEKVTPIRPKSNLHVEQGDFTAETTSSREFQSWEIKRPSPIVPRSNLAQEGTMDFTTTNFSEFEAKKPEKMQPFRPTTTNKISGEFDLTTTNQIMHAELPIERVKKIVPQPTLRMSSGVFSDETTNKTQFQEWEIDRPKLIRPVPNLTQEGTMDFTTMNKLQFEEKAIEKIGQFRPHTSSKMTGEFDGVTTNQVMFTAQHSERPRMVKPKGNLEVDKGKFSSDTTNISEFRQWEQTKPEAVTPRDNLHQEGALDFTTTNQTQYCVKNINKVSEIRPPTTSKIGGEFDGTTTNQLTFQNTPREKLQPIKPQNNLQVEKGNFAQETTNMKEFQQWEYSKPSPVKPHSSMRQEGEIDFSTTSNREFGMKTTEKISPVKPTSTTKLTGDFDGTTMNQMMFQTKSVERVKGKRPSTNIHLEQGKFEDQTTARREFQKWEIERPVPIKHGNNLTQEGTMDFMTSNRAEFEGKQITKVESIRPQAQSPASGKFDGTTTNQVMFQPQSPEKIRGVRPKDNLKVESGQFADETTNSKEFSYKGGSKPQAVRPIGNLKQEGDIDFTTSNQMQYEQKQIDKVSPIRPKTLTKASDGKFYSTTTNQAAFQNPIPTEIVRRVRPSDNLQVEKDKFQTETTSSKEYQQWKVQKPTSYQLTSSLKQEGDMQFETTNNAEFKERNCDRAQQIRPKTTNKTEGKFESTTTNQAMFQQHKLDRAKPIRQQNNLHVETGKFAGETTTSREFKQWVKMENKEPQLKRRSQAAGVSSRIEGTQTKETVTDSEKQHEQWKLNDSNEAMRESKLVNGRAQGDMKSSSLQTDSGISTSPSKTEQTSEQTLDAKRISTRREREMTFTQIPKDGFADTQTAHDTSTSSAANYGTKSTSQIKSLISNEGDIALRSTSKIDITQQIEPMYKKESTYVCGIESASADKSAWKLAKSEDSSKAIASSIEQKSSVTITSSPVRREAKNTSLGLSPSHVVTSRTTKRYRPADNLKIEHVPFDATSTTKTEYRKWETRKSSSKKRTESLKQEGSMEFNTTSNDYSAGKSYNASRDNVKARSKADQRSSLEQAGTMDFTTSNSAYSGNFTATKSKSVRPRSSIKLGSDETSKQDSMSSSRSNPEISTSRASYVGHTTNQRTVAHRPPTTTKIGAEGLFAGETTSKTSFTAHQNQMQKPRLMKPESHNILNTSNGFTGDTTYNNSFESKKGHCPVLDLHAGRLSMEFNEEKNGHMFYAPQVQA